MKAADFEAKLAAQTGTTRAQARRFIAAFRHTVTEALQANDKVPIPRLGTFRRVDKPRRRCYNPARGVQMTVPEHPAPKFTPAQELRRALK